MNIKELNEFMRDHGFCNTNNEDDLPKKYVCDLVESALEEGRNKAIDEFAEKLKETLNTYIEDAKDEGDYTYIEPFEISKRAVKEVAEQLKDGGENEY